MNTALDIILLLLIVMIFVPPALMLYALWIMLETISALVDKERKDDL